jgi:archaemetzincin
MMTQQKTSTLLKMAGKRAKIFLDVHCLVKQKVAGHGAAAQRRQLETVTRQNKGNCPMKKPWWTSAHACDPCGEHARLRACMRSKECAPPWAAALWPCFAPLKVEKGDWLAKGEAGEKDRKGQTLDQFLRPGPHRNFPSKYRRTIYLVAIGDMFGAPSFEVLAAFVEAYFGLEVKRGKALKEISAIQVCEEGAGYGIQLEAPDATRMLCARRERDAFVTVGYTMLDLCDSSKDFGFLFGQADVDQASGIFSFARYSDDKPSAALFLRRCAMVLCHEVGHLFGIKHCVWGSCVMNGSNHLAESERRPFAICPADLLKLEDSLRPVGGIDVVRREEQLLALFLAHGLDADAQAANERLACLTRGTLAPESGACGSTGASASNP